MFSDQSRISYVYWHGGACVISLPLMVLRVQFCLTPSVIIRPMAHDPSSPPKFLVPETGTSNFAHVPCILVPDFSGSRNLGLVGQCSIRHQKLWCMWPKCSAVIGRRDLHTHDTLYTQSIVCK